MNLAYFVDSGLLYERLILFEEKSNDHSHECSCGKVSVIVINNFVSYLFSYETKFLNNVVLLL